MAIDPFYGIPAERAAAAQRAQRILIGRGAYTFACGFDTGKHHGPTCDPRGIDCGCGWGDLCTAERGYFTGRPYTLCGALRYQRIASHRAPATALSSWQRPWSR